jgi:long-chain acyl-CoA synthetase
MLFIDGAMVPTLAALHDRMGSVRHVIALDDMPAPGCVREFETLLNAQPIGAAAVQDDDVVGIYYTGGTTGVSKGVMLTTATW